ncbi:hypothetical protein PIB30_095733 [Stylosanthes scabra]|uniref:Uncharacterized protein n=1 Tax=Stylosanthes scabra TaxID=79078 RepID=A0ABU6ZUK0_9FABA|nr:hypothetical protein [Stylosanthes scabra]
METALNFTDPFRNLTDPFRNLQSCTSEPLVKHSSSVQETDDDDVTGVGGEDAFGALLEQRCRAQQSQIRRKFPWLSSSASSRNSVLSESGDGIVMVEDPVVVARNTRRMSLLQWWR